MKLEQKKIHTKIIVEGFFFIFLRSGHVWAGEAHRIRALKKTTITELFSLNVILNIKFNYFCYQYFDNQSFPLFL